jgi:phage virion morphogenesis protein
VSKITIQVDDSQVEAALNEIEKAAGNMLPVFQVIGRKVTAKINIGFRSGRGPTGSVWAPLRFRNGQPLRDTGRLNRSITANATQQYVDIGTNVQYGPVHQFGATIKPKKAKRLVFANKARGGLVFAKQVTIPARPFLPLNAAGQVDLPPQWGADVLSALRTHFKV